jgi:WD40 repeat protein
VRLWDLSTRACTAVLQHAKHVSALVALEGGCLASGCYDFNIYLWNTASGAREALLEGHTGMVLSLAALPQGLLASGSEDKTVRMWNVAARTCVAVLQGHTGDVYGLAALPDGRLASGSWDKDDVIRVWELRP